MLEKESATRQFWKCLNVEDFLVHFHPNLEFLTQFQIRMKMNTKINMTILTMSHIVSTASRHRVLSTTATYLSTGWLLALGMVLSRGRCCCRNWFRSPNFMYSTMTQSGSSWVHTPITRTMLGSFRRDMILTSLWKSPLEKNTNKIRDVKMLKICTQVFWNSRALGRLNLVDVL